MHSNICLESRVLTKLIRSAIFPKCVGAARVVRTILRMTVADIADHLRADANHSWRTRSQWRHLTGRELQDLAGFNWPVMKRFVDMMGDLAGVSVTRRARPTRSAADNLQLTVQRQLGSLKQTQKLDINQTNGSAMCSRPVSPSMSAKNGLFTDTVGLECYSTLVWLWPWIQDSDTVTCNLVSRQTLSLSFLRSQQMRTSFGWKGKLRQVWLILFVDKRVGGR